MKIILLFLILFGSFKYFSAQPIWIVNALKNIRRAVMVAQRTKNATKLAVALGKCANALPDAEINRLARIASKPNGLKEMNKILGAANLPGKLGVEAGHLVLQDTYLRVAIKNGRLSKKVAAEAMEQLGGTPGFTSLLSKINSSSFSQAKGHLRELEIALFAQKRGFTTISLGEKFADGLKKGDTDLDVFLFRNGKKFAIESKAYSGIVPDIMVKADAESLIAFCKEINNTIPVFCFETPPSAFAQYFLTKKGIKCLIGNSDEIIAKLDILSNIGDIKSILLKFCL